MPLMHNPASDDSETILTMTDKKPTCFVAMPVTTAPEVIALYGNDKEHFLHVLDHLFSPAIAKSGYDIIKPVMTGADVIQATIIRNLEEADLVLCDISQHNPNVFFELGIRTALDRPIALVKDDKTGKLPFDTSIINTYSYDSALNPWTLENQMLGISEHISASANGAKGRNGLWQHFGLTQRAAVPASTNDPTGVKIDLILEELKRLRPESGEIREEDQHVLDPAGREFLQGASDSQNINQYPKRYQDLIRDLTRIASRISAEIQVLSITDKSVVIDAGPFMIRGVLPELERRAAREDMKLVLQSSGD